MTRLARLPDAKGPIAAVVLFIPFRSGTLDHSATVALVEIKGSRS